VSNLAGARLVSLPLPHQPFPNNQRPAASVSPEAAALEVAAQRHLCDWRAKARRLQDSVQLRYEDALGALLLANGDLDDAQVLFGIY
jgi:hypothetical protein